MAETTNDQAQAQGQAQAQPTGGGPAQEAAPSVRVQPAPTGAARTVSTEVADAKAKGGLDVGSLVLIAVLLAAGAILKLTLASVLTFAGMKPNFIIAMYCLAILLVKPNPAQSLIIGFIAGCVCQIPMLNATPYLNLLSEALGGLVMGLLIYVPMKIGKVDFQAPVATFISTVVSGYTFVLLLAAMNGISIPVALVTYAVMVFGTALFNAILVTILVVPLRKVLKR